MKLAEKKLQGVGSDVRRLHYLSVPPKAAQDVIRQLEEADLVERGLEVITVESPYLVAEERGCRRCVPAARYLVRLIGEGYERQEIEEHYASRFGRERPVEIDIEGAPVRGSPMAQITIVEDDHIREIAFFQFEAVASAVMAGSDRPGPLPPGTFSNRTEYAARPPKNLIAIVVDLINNFIIFIYIIIVMYIFIKVIFFIIFIKIFIKTRIFIIFFIIFIIIFNPHLHHQIQDILHLYYNGDEQHGTLMWLNDDLHV